MISADGRFILAFNGEVYNFRRLRTELEKSGHAFRGGSDTEVMLAAFCEWGVERALQRFIGMFALAVWNTTNRTLQLARDRLGKKPLYYGYQGSTFLFGSQIKALRAHPSFSAPINRDALASYVRLSYVPGVHSIYEGIYRLAPGSLLCLGEDDFGQLPNATPYWDPGSVVSLHQSALFAGGDQEAVEEFSSLLKDAVGLRMLADVPVGAFLSGGLDSSTIVAFMQAQSLKPVRTFSIGFHEAQFNEAHHAKAVATHLRSDHTELYVAPKDALALVPELPGIYDEPFADPSQIPTCLVSKLARKEVTVALSGDGGDELLGGYDRYTIGSRLWGYIRYLPTGLRSHFSRLLRMPSPDTWDRLLAKAPQFLQRRAHLSGDRIQKLAALLEVRDFDALYSSLIACWPTPRAVVRYGKELTTVFDVRGDQATFSDPRHRMMYLDLVSYLVDDILVKVDRAAMSVSLEPRAPLLDHRIVEFAWSLPMRFKIRSGRGKWLLRQVLDRYVPLHLVDRPKMGFGVPIDSWLRGPLRGWAEELLSVKRIAYDGFFDPDPIRKAWREHLSRERNWQYRLWNILMFQAWLASARP
jgi:asparagine synthase (glutamine-hydrolysing)